jgi:hypothetical protein
VGAANVGVAGGGLAETTLIEGLPSVEPSLVEAWDVVGSRT